MIWTIETKVRSRRWSMRRPTLPQVNAVHYRETANFMGTWSSVVCTAKCALNRNVVNNRRFMAHYFYGIKQDNQH